MTSRWLRRGLWASGIAAFVAAVAIVALPYIASTRIVRDRIAWEMSNWTGYRVTITGSPQINIWPQFNAVLTQVSFSRWDKSEQEPVIYAEQIEIGLSAMAALRGEVQFSSTRLIRPVIRVEQADSGLYLPPMPDTGTIGRAVEAARMIIKSGTAEPDPASLPATAIGSAEIRDGRIVMQVNGQDEEVLSSISARANWAAPGTSSLLSASAIWRGENVTIDASTQRPLLLAAGGAAPLSFSIKSAPASLSFEGKAELSINPFIEGNVKFQSPSLRRVMEWTGLPMASATSISAALLDSHILGNRERIKFDTTRITLGKNSGAGVLDLAFGQAGRPALSGTLAFETLDLDPFIAAFTPLTSPAFAGAGAADPTAPELLHFDLRLSAAKASINTIPLTTLAATIQVKDGLCVLDVSDATAFGGNIQSSIRFDRTPSGTQAEMRLLASDVNGAAFGAAFDMTRLMPTGKGTVSVILKGPGKSWDSVVENADGSISASFGPGALTGLDLAAFLKRNAEGGFFALDEVANGSVPISSAEFKANITKGVVRIEKAQATQGNLLLWLNGIMPYAGRGLALTGGIANQQPENSDGTEASPPASQAEFFVGGSWTAPFISPISTP
ncbi:AsmA family protein [Aquamicrobium segne]|uniref:AsmA family protein n=1 Tax=Aquamicrobium segne TaxID=469547 RepID=A0ABW0GZV5_9HYPH